QRAIVDVCNAVVRAVDSAGLGDAAGGDGVGKVVAAVEVSARRVGDAAVNQERHGAVGPLGHAGDDRGRLEVVRTGAARAGDDIGGGGGVLVGGQRIVGPVGDGAERD